MANRKLGTLPVAASILVSFISAITVLGTPAEMYTRGTQMFIRTIGYCLSLLISSLVFVPLFFPLKITSSFEVTTILLLNLFIYFVGFAIQVYSKAGDGQTFIVREFRKVNLCRLFNSFT